MFCVIRKLRDRLAPVVLHGNALILNRDPGDELEFRLWMRREGPPSQWALGWWLKLEWEDQNLELLNGDVEVKPPLGSCVWGYHENVDNA